MRHVEKALMKLFTKRQDSKILEFIHIQNKEDIKGIPPIISFTIQSDPIKEVGINGLQASDLLEYTKFLFESLNDAFPCHENVMTIKNIEAAIKWQEARTEDRQKRGVEGENKH